MAQGPVWRTPRSFLVLSNKRRRHAREYSRMGREDYVTPVVAWLFAEWPPVLARVVQAVLAPLSRWEGHACRVITTARASGPPIFSNQTGGPEALCILVTRHAPFHAQAEPSENTGFDPPASASLHRGPGARVGRAFGCGLPAAHLPI